MNTTKYLLSASVSLLFGGLSASSLFAANTFELLPANSVATDMSADGSVVIGTNGSAGFRWTHQTGATRLGGFPQNFNALSISDDGLRIFGEYYSGGNRYVYVWTALNGIEFSAQVSTVTRYSSWQESFNPVAMSGDGLFILTYEGIWGGSYRWEIASGKKDRINDPSDLQAVIDPAGISADGSVIVGNGIFGDYRWTKATGAARIDYGGSVTGLSPDGRVIIGGGNRAFLWTTSSGLVQLDLPSGASSSLATAASADGSVIVGKTNQPKAFRWDKDNGVVFIADQLTAAGIDLGGFAFQTPIALSADGTVIAGNGVDREGIAHAWIAKIDSIFATPTPSPAPTPSSTPLPPPVTSSPTPLPSARPVLNVRGVPSTTRLAALRVEGTTRGPVSSITYRIRPTGQHGVASGASLWHFTTRLSRGRNTLTVVAHSPGGDSIPLKIVVVRK